MANPFDRFDKKPAANPFDRFDEPETNIVDDIMQGPVGQAGLGALEGLTSLPGIPVEAGVLLGNVANYATGKPWRSVEEDPNLKDWGARGWQEFAQRNLGVPQGPAPQGEIERVARKAGNFAGGALPFGPAGVIPSLTATAGSEVGRATDEAGLTGGYGEVVGAIAGGAAPGLVRGATTSGMRGAPTNQELRRLSKQAYLAAENAGDIVGPAELQQLTSTIKGELASFGYLPKLQPRVAAALEELDNVSQGHVTLKGLDMVRRVAKSVSEGNPSERAISGMMVEQIDDLIDSLQGGPMMTSARNYWKRLRKSEMIDEATGKAERRAASTGSGGNADNATRQNIRAILDNPKKARLFSAAEKQLMERVVRGSTAQNALRLIGKLSPEGSGLMTAFGIGATAVNPAMSAFPAAGYVAKQVADALTSRNASRLSQMVRRGGASSTATIRDRANELFLEAVRRGRLAGRSTLPVLPGTLALRPSQAP